MWCAVKTLGRYEDSGELFAMDVSKDNRLLVCGGASHQLTLLKVGFLHVLHRLPTRCRTPGPNRYRGTQAQGAPQPAVPGPPTERSRQGGRETPPLLTFPVLRVAMHPRSTQRARRPKCCLPLILGGCCCLSSSRRGSAHRSPEGANLKKTLGMRLGTLQRLRWQTVLRQQ